MNTVDQRVAHHESAVVQEMRAGFSQVNQRLDTVNGRLRKTEVALAVLKFAVYTIGGALAYGGFQIVVSRLGGH